MEYYRAWLEFLIGMHCIHVALLLCYILYIKNFGGKNFDKFSELQQFTKFLTHFHYFHNIPYVRKWTSSFSTKFSVVIIHQTFLLPTLFTIRYRSCIVTLLLTMLPV